MVELQGRRELRTQEQTFGAKRSLMAHSSGNMEPKNKAIFRIGFRKADLTLCRSLSSTESSFYIRNPVVFPKSAHLYLSDGGSRPTFLYSPTFLTARRTSTKWLKSRRLKNSSSTFRCAEVDYMLSVGLQLTFTPKYFNGIAKKRTTRFGTQPYTPDRQTL